MRVLAWDTETELIRPGKQAPDLVCITWQSNGEEPQIIWQGDPKAFALVQGWLQDDEVLMVGQNVAFDMAVIGSRWPSLLPLIFAKYDKDLVTDTMLRQQLLDLACNCYRGRMGDGNKWVKYNYSLDDLVHRVRGSRLKKDGWRMAYSFFKEAPLEEWTERAKQVQEMARGWLATALFDGKTKQYSGRWPEMMEYKDVQAIVDDVPEGAVLYPLEDAKATLEVFNWQEPHSEWLVDQFRQSRAAFALNLSSIYGLRTTPRGVAEFEAVTQEEYDELKAKLLEHGLVRPDGSRNMKVATEAMVVACERLEIPIRMTDGGKPSLDRDSCDAVDDSVIKAYSAYQTASKILSNDIVGLKKGTHLPIHPRYGLADTGRTTCTGFNIQALRRKAGIREVFVPRKGCVFIQADYEGLELHTFAEVCHSLFGVSKMGEWLRDGLDPHLIMASRILNITYDEAKKRYKEGDPELKSKRQVSKPCNFGFIDGLGPASLVDYARKTYGVILDEQQAKDLKDVWLQTVPEARLYFNYVRDLCKYEGSNGKQIGEITQLYVGRKRWGTFTSNCSALHQGLGADCAKNATWLVSKAQYTQPQSPLFGTRTVAFVHDEIIAEAKEDEKLHEATMELGNVMLQGANHFLKHAPARISPQAMDCWSKDAKPMFDERGRIKVWRLNEFLAGAYV